jgi:hypothetical protein
MARKYSKQAVEQGAGADEVAEQLAAELASYEAAKPWRERQTMEEAGAAAGEADDRDPAKGEPKRIADPADAAQGNVPADKAREPLKPRRPFQD